MASKDTPDTVKNAVDAPENVYTATELAENHDAFNTSYEIVAVALRLAGKDKATVSEATTIIEKFKNKEVK